MAAPAGLALTNACAYVLRRLRGFSGLSGPDFRDREEGGHGLVG